MSVDTLTVSDAVAGPRDRDTSSNIQAFHDPDGPSFHDLLDILNPLQHIPIINTIYRHLTGDTEGAVADVAGGTLWAGPIGLVGSLVDLAVKNESGKSIGDNVLAWLGFDDDDSGVAVAQNEQANPNSAPAQAAQQTAAVQAAPIVLAAAQPAAPAPRVKKDDDKDNKDGPQQKGEYLVFGGSGSPIQVSAPAAPTPVQAAAAYAPPQQKGQYMVFGGAAASAPAPAPMTVASAAPAPSTPAGLTPLPARSFAVPARRSQTAPTVLPPPTTGPAAIPGRGPSQALPPSNDGDWFLGAVAANLDKYQAAAKLSQNNSADNATVH